MHSFTHDMSRIQAITASKFAKRAEGVYRENLTAYIKIVLRRPFARILVRRGTKKTELETDMTLGLL